MYLYVCMSMYVCSVGRHERMCVYVYMYFQSYMHKCDCMNVLCMYPIIYACIMYIYYAYMYLCMHSCTKMEFHYFHISIISDFMIS